MSKYEGQACFIYDGYASLNGTPDHLVPKLEPMNLLDAPHGLSGTEVNMFGLAYELASRGWEIMILSKWTHPRIGRWGEFENMRGIVRFEDLGMCTSGYPKWLQDQSQFVLAYHDGRPLEAWSGCLKIAHHQSYGLSPTEDRKNLADLYWTPTERVSSYHRKLRGWDVVTIPNAWNFGTFHEWRPVPGRLIYHTSMERGFHRLVEAFPHIKERVPEAHIVAFGRGGPDAAQKMGKLMLELSKGSVTESQLWMHSSRNKVLEILSTAACFAYPCDVPSPCEVWPMSVTDALATGVPVVLAPDDGIEEIFRGGAQITREVKKGDWLEEFVNETCLMLNPHGVSYDHKNPAWWRSDEGKRWADPFTFKNQCDRFLEMVGKWI